MALQTKKEYAPLVPLVLEGSGPFCLIGDVHGCVDELQDLLALVEQVHGPDVTFISLGDICDRGPDVHGCFDLLRSVGSHMVIGNHDEKLGRWHKGNAVKMGAGQLASTDSMQEEDFAFIEKAHPFVRLPHYNVIGVHGGFFPYVPPEKQNLKQIIRLRDISGSKMFHLGDEGGTFWADLWKGPETVIFGHAWAKQVRRFPHAIGIDTGLVYGNYLSAAILTPESTEIEVLQIKARKTYWDDSHGE